MEACRSMRRTDYNIRAFLLSSCTGPSENSCTYPSASVPFSIHGVKTIKLRLLLTNAYHIRLDSFPRYAPYFSMCGCYSLALVPLVNTLSACPVAAFLDLCYYGGISNARGAGKEYGWVCLPTMLLRACLYPEY